MPTKRVDAVPAVGPAPMLGATVFYRLSEQDAAEINHRRQRAADAPRSQWGFQTHYGNHAAAGQEFPALVVRRFGDRADQAVNLTVQLDGTDTYWATSRLAGEGPGRWSWTPAD